MFRKLALFSAASLASLAASGAANAHTFPQILDLGGYSSHVTDVGDGCLITTAESSQTSFSGNTCDPDYQGRLDAFYDRVTAPAPPPPAAPPATTPVATPTTPISTAPVPVVVAPVAPAATAPVAAAPISTAAAPAVAATAVAPTVAPTVDVSALEARIAALEAQIAALTNRVDRLALAGDASSAAFEQALIDGKDVRTAADLARGTFLNVVYGLGRYST